jgi:quinolinate synthase
VVSSYAYIAGLADVCVTNCAKVVNLRDSLLTNPGTQLAKNLEEHTAKTLAFFDGQTPVPVCIPPTAATLLRDLEF